MYSSETNHLGLLISARTCLDHELMERYIIIWLCEVVSTRNGKKNGLWHHPMWKLNSVALAETCWNTAITTLLALKTANKISGKNSAPTQEIMAPAMPSPREHRPALTVTISLLPVSSIDYTSWIWLLTHPCSLPPRTSTTMVWEAQWHWVWVGKDNLQSGVQEVWVRVCCSLEQ